MTFHGKNFVAGNLSEGCGKTLHAISPLNSARLEGDFFEAGENDVDAALRIAEKAFASFRDAAPEQRANFLEKIADEILTLGDALIERAHLETGLPRERLTGERARTCGQLKLFAQVAREGSWRDARIDTADPDRKPLPKPDVRRMLRAMGPVVVFGASNFPLAFSVAGGDTASALATGNPVIVKAHEAHPGTSELVATAIRRAVEACGLPAGVFSMLHGDGRTVGIALVRHPLTRAVGFTGSRRAGRALFDAAASRPNPIPVFAEMSSINPVFLLPGALRERGAQLAETLRQSITLGVGQFCTKPGLIFGIESDELKKFRETLAGSFKSAAPAIMLHGGICKSFFAGIARVEKVAGVKFLAKSSQAAEVEKTHGAPMVAETTLENFLSEPELAEEIFGPFALLIAAKKMEELETVAERLEGQLTATLLATAEEMAQCAQLVKILERKAGRLVFNGVPTGVEVCHAMHHGGPWPATSDPRFTSVGTAALLRFVRPVCFQNFPRELLPDELRNENPQRLWRMVNGEWTKAALQ